MKKTLTKNWTNISRVSSFTVTFTWCYEESV